MRDPGPPIDHATTAYEAWLGANLPAPLLARDLEIKHERMAKSAFQFLRATFYRWADRFVALCPELTAAPVILGVGDLHVENFGTWRDAEGRLAWGVNDFDEACELPWTSDLVRLATSADLAAAEQELHLDSADACAAILEGYAAALGDGGCPFVLGERHRWLRDLALGDLRDPARFWEKLEHALPLDGAPPPDALAAIRGALPRADLPHRLLHRIAGLGSLGRPRYTAIAEWCGGRIAREVKPLAPSAWRFAGAGAGDERIHYADLLARAVRDPDPFYTVAGRWIARRLSPDCCRIELAELDAGREAARLLAAMGYETANVHLGTAAARDALRGDLARRPSRWLHDASSRMLDSVRHDFNACRAAWKKQRG